VKNMLLNRRWAWTVLSLSAVVSAGCAAGYNPALQRARDAYQQARQDPEVGRRAAVALEKAGQTLEQAERLWEKEKDVQEVEHLAYIAEKRAEIARVIAKRRAAADEIQQLKAQQ
jgi:OmpA-OmpF porin, OOP family